jgi:molybdopterin/thiamine biosynthesis adenylyltransferase
MMHIEERPGTENEHRQTLVIVGLGNIGSALAALAARMPIGRVTLVDSDTYCEKNLGSQVMFPGDVGKPKAKIQAQRVRQIRPGLEVRAVNARVEDVPLGMLRADVILAGLDSRTSRRYVNQAAWRLGVPWIDAAVDAPGLLARVNVYVPGQDAPCAECAWDDGDYAALEQAYPCQPDGNGVAATNAPASLGAVTAGMMAVECQKLLDGDMEHLLDGRQVMLDLRHHTSRRD